MCLCSAALLHAAVHAQPCRPACVPQALGQTPPNNACFILCGSDCQALRGRLTATIDATIQQYTANPELRFREAAEAEEEKAAAAAAAAAQAAEDAAAAAAAQQLGEQPQQRKKKKKKRRAY